VIIKTDPYIYTAAELAEEGKVDHVEVWFNFSEQFWTIQNVDANGYQIGDAWYTYYKYQALDYARESKVPIVVENRVNGAKKTINCKGGK